MTSTGLDVAAGITSLVKGEKVRAEYQPKSFLEKLVFGEESIRGIGLKQQERQDYFMEKGANPAQAIGLSAVLTGNETAADLFPIGAEYFANAGFKKLTAVTIAKQAEKVASQADDVVGIIAQGRKADLPKAERALRNAISGVDVSEIKTADDLIGVMEGNRKGVMQAVDNILDLNPNKYKDVAPVSQALDDFVELGEKTRNPGLVSQATALKNKMVSEGLSAKEINNVARQYSAEFGQKAFSARTGEALTNVNAQAYENTRTAVKEYVRQFYDNDALKVLDGAYSDMARTEDLLRESAEAVNKARQKATQGGLPVLKDVPHPKFTLGSFIDSTLGALRGKPFTWKDWEKQLNANLRKLERLNKLEGTNFADEVSRLFSEGVSGLKANIWNKAHGK